MSDAASSAPVLPPPPDSRPRNGRPSGPPLFLLALLVAATVHVGALVLFNFTVLPATPIIPPPPTPYIHFNPDSPVLRQFIAEAQYSPEQTYLSTDRSFSSQSLPRPATPTPPLFDSYTVKPAASEVDFHQPISAAPIVTSPGDALKPTQWDLLNSFGQAPSATQPLAARGAFVRITRLDPLAQSHFAPVEITWPASMAPPTANPSWRPVSFYLQFNAAGLAGEPVLEPALDALSQSNAPNDPEVNNFLREKLRDWLTQPQHPPLPPGHYEAVVGP